MQLRNVTSLTNAISRKTISLATPDCMACYCGRVMWNVPSLLAPRSFSSTSESPIEETAESLAQERENIMAEAKLLTLSLYRSCTRSVRIIRHANDYDRKEFEKREQKRILEASQPRDPRLSMLSTLPAVDPEEELRSRGDYYQEYARENFFQESDCLKWEVWEPQHIDRYVTFLRRGEHKRHWLLTSMRFEDPLKGKFPTARVEEFERRAHDHVRRVKDFRMRKKLSPQEYERYLEENNNKNVNEHDDEEEDVDEDWTTEEEEENDGVERGLPSWYKNPSSP